MAKFTIGSADQYTVYVDDDDLERVLAEGGWCPHECETNVYARKTVRVQGRRKDGTKGTVQRKIYLHRWLMDVTDKKIVVDHDDRNGLNNRRKNLIITDTSGNAKNRTYGLMANVKRLHPRNKEKKRKNG